MRRSVFWGAYGPRVAGDVGQAVGPAGEDHDEARQGRDHNLNSDHDLGRVEQVKVKLNFIGLHLLEWLGGNVIAQVAGA